MIPMLKGSTAAGGMVLSDALERERAIDWHGSSNTFPGGQLTDRFLTVFGGFCCMYWVI